MSLRRVLLRVAAVLGGAVLVAAGAVAVLVVWYPQPVAEWYAAHALGRQLSFGSLRINWGNPLIVEARDIRLANAPWAGTPYMFQADYMTAAVDTDALFHGVLRYRALRMEKPVLFLERNDKGDRNWRLAGTGGGADGGFAIVPKTRTQFPILLDFAMRNGAVVLRRPNSRDIRIDFYTLRILTRGDDQPVQLAVDGAYNGAALRLNADTHSFLELRNGTVPFGANISIAAAPGTVDFNGTLAEPLDFEGVRGPLKVDAQNLRDLLKIFDAGAPLAFPLRIAGPFEKTGEHWQITRGDGHMPAGVFNGDVALDEGDHGAPDAITLDLAFDRLDATTLLAGQTSSNDPIALQPDTQPGAVFDAKLAAQTLVYEKFRLTAFKAHGRTQPGNVSVDDLSFKFAGGTVEGGGSARAVPDGGDVAANAVAVALDASQVLEILGEDQRELKGLVDGRVTLSMEGPTLSEALKHSHGAAVVAMTQGRVSRDLVERASLDLRSLFRSGQEDARLTCLLGVAEMKDGMATIGTVRLRTPEATLIAGGRVDLVAGHVDLTIRSERGSIFALKVPLHLSGTLQKVAIRPALGSAPPVVNGEAVIQRLSPGLRELAAGNPCLR